jgi:hypothetical protein
MPLVDVAPMLNKYDPDAVVDADWPYVPPVAADRDSDHNLTSDTHTDSLDDNDSSSHDSGHHPDFDDVLAPSPVAAPVPAVPMVHPPAEERPCPLPPSTHQITNPITPTEEHNTAQNKERIGAQNEERVIV